MKVGIFIICIFAVFSCSSVSPNTSVPLIKNNETQFFVKSMNVEHKEKSVLPLEIQSAKNILHAMGYRQTKRDPRFFEEEMYKMVYLDMYVNKNGYSTHSFEENGIRFIISRLIDKPNDPNYYTSATISANGVRYWFVKINFFLEYSRVEEWFSVDRNEFIEYKIFY
ncbi:MAG: hypothetical protein Ta2B_00500 [Termitinemataceae bacterium]|nr:MAG: hypothetical protein Ta2B_00500 [Termitinemataceae bacterium]